MDRDQIISDFVRSISDDETVLRLLDVSVLRVLTKKPHLFDADHIEEDIRFVADWLIRSVESDAPWLTKLDARGRPKKLMKFSSVEGMVSEALKASRADRSRHGVIALHEGEEIFIDLTDGFRLVRILHPDRLREEGIAMQHCMCSINHAGILSRESEAILSLRDPYGAPHVTIHANLAARRVLEMRGKQNDDPNDRYIALLRPFLDEMVETGLVHGKDGFVMGCALRDLPDGTIVNGSLYINDVRLPKLPQNLTVLGDMVLTTGKIRKLPTGLRVRGDLYVGGASNSRSRISSLPPDLVVEGSLDIGNTRIRTIPSSIVAGSIRASGSLVRTLENGLSLAGSLDLAASSIRKLPASLSVGGFLDLAATKIKEIPATVRCKGINLIGTRVARIPEGVADGGSVYCGTSLRDLPLGLQVVGTLDLGCSGVVQLPSDLSTVVTLNVDRSRIATLPDGMDALRSLRIDYSDITKLPNDVVLDRLFARGSKLASLPSEFELGFADLSGCPIEKLPEGLRVANDLVISGSAIEALPDRLAVKGSVIASGSSLRRIGQGVEIGGFLTAIGTPLEALPDDLFASRGQGPSGLILTDTPISALPEVEAHVSTLEIGGTRISYLPGTWRVSRLVADPGMVLRNPEKVASIETANAPRTIIQKSIIGLDGLLDRWVTTAYDNIAPLIGAMLRYR